MCSLPKEQSTLSRETIQNAFFPELCPFFDLDFFLLSSTRQPSVGTRMRCSCLKTVCKFKCMLAPALSILSPNGHLTIEQKSSQEDIRCKPFT